MSLYDGWVYGGKGEKRYKKMVWVDMGPALGFAGLLDEWDPGFSTRMGYNGMDRAGPGLGRVGYDMTATNHVGLRTTMNNS